MSLKKFIENQETSLKKLIKERDEELANKIYMEYCIPVVDILKLFEESKIIPSKYSCHDNESINCNKCSYVFKRGVKAGKNCCTIIKNTEEYCSKHKIKKSKKDSETKKSRLILRKHSFFKSLFFS